MNLRQMEVFRAVMLTGSVAGAAELLHVSQPSVSKALALGERRLGLRLFDRVKGRLVATPEGKRLYAEVERLWAGVEKVRVLAGELAAPAAGTLHIGASPGVGAWLIPDVTTAMCAELPGLEVRMDLLVPHLLVESVVEHSIDVALSLFAIEHPNLVKVAQYRLGWACALPPGHPLCAKKVITPRDLVGWRLVTLPFQLSYGIAPQELFGAVLPQLQFGVHVRAGQSACHFCAAGAGVAVVDELTVRGNAFPQLEVRPFRTGAPLTVTVAHNADRPLSRIARAFCDAVDGRLRA